MDLEFVSKAGHELVLITLKIMELNIWNSIFGHYNLKYCMLNIALSSGLFYEEWEARK